MRRLLGLTLLIAANTASAADPALNHLGITGEGPGSLAEYHTPGQVDARLIDDVAVWIRQQ